MLPWSTRNKLLAACLVLVLGGDADARVRRPRLRKELEQVQRDEGLSLLAVDRGAVRRLDFRTGKLRLLVRLPRELADFPEPDEHLENNSLNWRRQKLAGLRRKGLFVADLATGRVRYYGRIGASRMTLSNRGDKVALLVDDRLCVLDLTTRAFKEIAPRANLATVPQWSADDTRLLFTTEEFEVVLVDLKRGTKRVVGRDGGHATRVPGTDDITMTRVDRSGWPTSFGYWRVPPEGGRGKKLLGRDDVSRLFLYSPDGKYAAYERGPWWDFNIKGHEYGEVAVVRLADKKEVAVYGSYKIGSTTRANVLPLTWASVTPAPKPGK